MQAPFDIAADLDTPVSAYLKLADLEPGSLPSFAAASRVADRSVLWIKALRVTPGGR